MPKASSPSKMERKRAYSPVAEDDDHDQTFFVDEADGERFKMVFQGDLNRLSVAKIRRYLRLHNINDEDELRYEGRVLSDDMRGAEFGLKRGVVLKLRKPSPPRMAEHQAHHQQQQQRNNNNISAKGSNIKAKNSNINAKKKHVEEADSCRDGGSQTFEERVRLNKDMFALRFHIERVRDDARDTRDGASMKLPALHERHSPSPNAPTSSEMSSSDIPSPTVSKLKKKKLLLNKASSPAFSDVLVDASAPESYGRGDPNVVRPAKNARVRGCSPPRNNNNNNNTTNSNKNNAVSPEEMCGGPSLYIQRLHEMLRQAEALGYTPNNNNNNNATPHLQSSVLQLSPQQSGPQYEMPLGAGVAPDSLRSTPAVNAAANVATSTPGTARPPHTNTAINDNNNINSNNVMEEIRDVREAVLDMTGMLMEMKKRGVRHLSASSSTTDSSITLPREEYATYGAAAGDRRGVRQEDHVASLPMRVPSPLRPSHRDQQRQPIMDESGEEEFAQRLHDVLPRAEGVLQALLGALHVAAYEPLSARQREEGRGAVPPRTSSKKQHITPPSQSVFADEDSMPTGRAIGMELRGIRGLLKELEARVEGGGEGSGRLHPQQQQQQQQQQQRTPRQSPTSKDGHLLRATTPLGQDLRRVINYTEHALVDLVEVLQQSQRSQHDAAERSSPRPENQRISPDAGRRHSPRHAAHHVQDSTCARVAQPPPSQRSLSGRRSSPLQSASVHQHRRRGEHHRHPSSGRKEAAESREEAILHEVHDIHQALRNLVMREDEGAESRTSPIRGQRHPSQHAGRFSADVPSPHSSAARSVDTRSTRPPPPSSATDAPIYDGQRLHETVQRAEQVIHHLLHIAQGQPNVVAAANNNKMGEAPNVSTLERKDTKRFDQTPYSGPLGVGVGAQDTSTTGSTLIQQSVVEQLGSVQHMVEDLARVVRSQHNLHDPSTSSPSAAVGAARTTPVSRQFEVLPLPPSATGFGEFASAQLGQQQHNRSAPASPPLPQQQQQQQQFDVDGGVPSHVVEKRLKHITVEVEEVLSGLTQLVRALEERGISPTTTISKTMNDGSSRHTLPEPSYENRAAPHASASNVVDQPQQMAFREQFYTELPSQAVEVAPMTELHPGQSATLQLSTQMRSYNDVDVQQQQHPYSGSLQSQHSPLSQQSSRQISGRGSLGSQPTNANNNNIISSRGSTKQLYRQALTMLGDVENILGDLRGIVGNEGQPAQS